MTPEQQRIAIAQACGWTDIRTSEPWEFWDDLPRQRLVGEREGGGYEVPDHLNDLNAMHEAEKVLTDEQHNIFKKQLSWLVGWRGSPAYSQSGWRRKYVSATAAQRAEAFLRTLNLWTTK